MPALKPAVRKPAKVPAFLAKNLARRGSVAAPPPAATSTKAPPASAPTVQVLPQVQPVGPPSGPGGGNLTLRKRHYLKSHPHGKAQHLSAVHQARAIDRRQGLSSGGTAAVAVHRNEIKTAKAVSIAARSPLVTKNATPPSANLRVGKKVITSAFQQTRFHTPFQKNANLRRLTGIY